MVDQSEFISLGQIVQEIDNILTKARHDLNQYSNSPINIELLNSCHAKIIQVNSTISILKKRGATLFVQEIVHLLDSLKASPFDNTQKKISTLTKAMLHLPIYLVHTTKTGKEDVNQLTFLIKNMRQLRAQPTSSNIDLSPTRLAPTIAPIPEEQLKKLQDSGFTQLVRKLRQKYQLCLSGILRENQSQRHLDIISKIFAKLQNLCWGAPISPLWDACTSFAEGLKEGSIAIDKQAISILRSIDNELKFFISEQSKRLNTLPSENILGNIINRINEANSDNHLIQSLKRKYALKKTEESDYPDIDLDSVTVETHVVEPITKELNRTRHTLDLFRLTHEGNKSKLKEQLTICKQITDTLGMMNVEKLQKIMQKQCQYLETIINTHLSSEEINHTLIHISEQLLEVEFNLNQFINVNESVTNQFRKSIPLSDVHQTMIHRTLQTLLKAKSVVVDYLGNRHNVDNIKKLSSLVKSIHIDLSKTPLYSASELVDRCYHYIQTRWMKKSLKPSFDEIEATIDTLSSIEHYLNQLSDETSNNPEITLNLAKESLDKLESTDDISQIKKPLIVSPSPDDETMNTIPEQHSFDQSINSVGESTTQKLFETNDTQPIETPKNTITSTEKKNQHTISLEHKTDFQKQAETVNKEPITPFSPIKIADMESIFPETVPVENLEIDVDEPLLTHNMPLSEDDLANQEVFSSADESPLSEIAKLSTDDTIAQHAMTGSHDVVDNILLHLEDIQADSSIKIQNRSTVDDFDIHPHDAFVNKATELQQKLQHLQSVWKNNINDIATVKEIRKTFHNLQLNEQIIGAEVISELTCAVENMLNSVIAGSTVVSEPIADLVDKVITLLPELINDFSNGRQQLTPEVLLCMEKADALGNGTIFDVDSQAVTESDKEEPAMMFGTVLEENVSEHDNFDSVTEDPSNAQNQKLFEYPDTNYDPQLLKIFTREAGIILNSVKEFINSSQNLDSSIQIPAAIHIAFSNLKDGVHVAEITPLFKLIDAIEETIGQLRIHQSMVDSETISTIEHGTNLIESAMQQLQIAPYSINIKIDQFLERLDTINNRLPRKQHLKTSFPSTTQSEPKYNPPLSETHFGILTHASKTLKISGNNIPHEQFDQLKSTLSILIENSEALGMPSIVELANVLQNICVFLDIEDATLPEQHLSQISDGFETLVSMLQEASFKPLPELPQDVLKSLYESLQYLRVKHKSPLARDETNDTYEHNIEKNYYDFLLNNESQKTAGSLTKHQNFHHENDLANHAESNKVPPFTDLIHQSQSEHELNQQFFEQAYTLLKNSGKSLGTWLTSTNDLQPVHELKQYMQSLYNTAKRMELTELQVLSHALEMIYEAVLNGYCTPDNAPLALIQKANNTINNTLQKLSNGQTLPNTNDLIKEIQQWLESLGLNKTTTSEDVDLADYLGHSINLEKTASDTQVKEDSVHTERQQSKLSVQSTEQIMDPISTTRVAPTDLDFVDGIFHSVSTAMIEISPDRVENMLSLSESANINHSRIGQKTKDSNKLLGEMDQTIHMIQKQLQDLDTQTKRPIDPQKQNNTEDNQGTNTLIESQPSELLSISNLLSESLSNLIDQHQVLQDINHDSEALLQQQSRTHLELQNLLTKTRFVPVSQLVPVLRQIVRNVSDEESKPVEFLVSNAEVEIDRTMIDMIIASLEHIIRNAIEHGIENSVEERNRSGKPEAGQISLSINRDGNDVVIKLSDDGKGFDIQTIKNKAIEQNLMSPGSTISDQEIIKLVMKEGISTSRHITQTESRKNGLDRVNEMIKNIGGSIQIRSTPNLGTQFSIRMPLNLSINRALIVEVSGNMYALPMHSIGGVAMISSKILTNCYKTKSPLIYGNNIEHQLIYMGELFNTTRPTLNDGQYPVILVEKDGENIAFQVDSISGSQEIITKNLGVQFSSVAWVKGASILSDGRVVVIIDPAELYNKNKLPKANTEALNKSNRQDRAIHILVVDDSATVRNVTSRLLSRHGFHITSVQNGMECMALLTSGQKPDIMLLDIEMPHMDGFEVASLVRNNPRLHDLPIIMISSSTGKKHRDQALSLGVNDYIGKPFHEGTLLEAIENVITVEAD